MSTALVTGGVGFLGRYLVRALLARGWRVRVLDLDHPEEAETEVEWRVGDVRDGDAVAQACTDTEVVFHLASLIPQRKADAEFMRAVNVGGAATVLKAAEDAHVGRVVYLSSAEVYGIPAVIPCPEDGPLAPLAEYGRNKIAAEALCREAVARGLEVVMLRPPTIIGAGLLEPFLLDLLGSLRAGKPVMLLGKGQNRFHFVHAADVAEACIAAAQRPGIAGEAFNIAGPDPLPIREIAEAVIERSGAASRIRALPVPLVRVLIAVLGLVGKAPLQPEHLAIALADYVFDTAKAREQLGWSPRWATVEALLDSYSGLSAADEGAS